MSYSDLMIRVIILISSQVTNLTISSQVKLNCFLLLLLLSFSPLLTFSLVFPKSLSFSHDMITQQATAHFIFERFVCYESNSNQLRIS